MNLTYDIGFIYNPDLKVEKTFDYRDKIFSNQLIIGEVPWGNIEAGINGVKSVFMPAGAFDIKTDFPVKVVVQNFSNQIFTYSLPIGTTQVGNYTVPDSLIRKIISITSIRDVDTSANTKTISVSQTKQLTNQNLDPIVFYSGGFLVDNSYSNPFNLTTEYSIYQDNLIDQHNQFTLGVSGIASFSSGNYFDEFYNYSNIKNDLKFEAKNKFYNYSIKDLSLSRFLFSLTFNYDNELDKLEPFNLVLKITQGGR